MMKKYLLVVVLSSVCMHVCLAQDYDEYRPEQRSFNGASRYQFEEDAKTTTTQAPIAILKQINRHNEDGSYTYGYEGADGSFKIETKAANGDVKGKYGYFDGEKVRVVEYGADRHGFQPSGDGITVPPPTFHDERTLNSQYENGEDVQLQRQTARPKPVKQQPRPQSINYSQAPEQQRKYVAPSSPAKQQQQQQQQYNDYEEKVQAPTEKPVQPRPKFQSAAAPPRPQFANSIDIVYADTRPSQYEPRFENRQPAQFPSQELSSSQAQPTYGNRADEFTLFTPASNSRADTFKPKSSPTPQQIQQPSFANAPESQFQYSPQSFQTQRPAYASKPAQSRSTSILDQLAKDYALPAHGSAPLHDISFGYSV